MSDQTQRVPDPGVSTGANSTGTGVVGRRGVKPKPGRTKSTKKKKKKKRSQQRQHRRAKSLGPGVRPSSHKREVSSSFRAAAISFHNSNDAHDVPVRVTCRVKVNRLTAVFLHSGRDLCSFSAAAGNIVHSQCCTSKQGNRTRYPGKVAFAPFACAAM